MARPFSSTAIGSSGPAVGCIAITPNDSTDLTSDVRALTINVGGVVVYDGWDGVTYTTAALPAGTYALLARRVRSTSTTATGITGWV